MLIQDIVLYPTEYKLDVIIGSPEYLAQILSESYPDNANFERLEEVRSRDGALWEMQAEFNDEVEEKPDLFKIIMWCREFDIPSISHELIHVTWTVHRYTGIRMDMDGQEFQAYMHTWLLKKIMNYE